jgi:hypothetical protein
MTSAQFYCLSSVGNAAKDFPQPKMFDLLGWPGLSCAWIEADSIVEAPVWGFSKTGALNFRSVPINANPGHGHPEIHEILE